MGERLINGVSVPFIPVGGVDSLKRTVPSGLPAEDSFARVLQGEIGRLKFSKHAQERLETRNIALSEQDLQKLQGAVEKAEEKGAGESLVLLRDLAFIVSVKSRTVVTAIDGERLRDSVFTNIDSAIVAA